MHLADFSCGSLGESGIVGSLMPVAVGAGLSARLRKTDQVCLCFFGDGAANCGPFHESLNLAAIWRIPVIFLCENNGYAMFTPQSKTTPIADIADRASAYNIPGMVVDGQDVLAVFDAVSAATVRARSGHGPSLIEAKTFRYEEHSDCPGDIAPHYRAPEEVQTWRKRDPVELFVASLRNSSVFSTAEVDACRAAVLTEVEEAVEFSRSSAMPEPAELFGDFLVPA
jgi:pyruvate dehydrogenase E1 component alpha subunit